MRSAVIILLFSLSEISFSQIRNIRINIYKLEVSQNDIHIALNSQVENLNICRIQIINSLKKVIKTDDFPKATSKPGIKQWTEKTFLISDLIPGKYTLILLLGKEEFYWHRFYKNNN